jgi:hypothetical protein
MNEKQKPGPDHEHEHEHEHERERERELFEKLIIHFRDRRTFFSTVPSLKRTSVNGPLVFERCGRPCHACTCRTAPRLALPRRERPRHYVTGEKIYYLGLQSNYALQLVLTRK